MSLTEVSVRTGDAASGPGDERPLNEEERKLVARLFADPIVFPQTFKTWLVAFLEGSDLSLPMASILGLSGILSPGSGGGASGIMGALPAGLIFPCASTEPPAGTLMCDGRRVSKTTYQRLYKAIGDQYGPTGADFAIPDIQGRMIIGVGPGHPANQNEGRAAAARSPYHHHYFIDSKSFEAYGGTDGQGGHSHDFTYPQSRSYQTGQQGYVGFAMPDGFATPTTGVGDHGHNVSVSGSVQIEGNTSGGGDQDVPSYIAIPYVINY